MTKQINYTIKPIFLGSIIADKAASLYLYPPGESLKTVYACFALQAGDETILVDSGLPSQQDILKNNKPFRQMEDAPDFLTALAAARIAPEKIRNVILTHLHYDHCCNLRLLPNLKQVFVQKKELLHAVHPKENEMYFYSLQKKCGKPEWTDALGKFILLDGDAKILPGIQVLLTPGHSPGSQSVLVQTQKGPHLLTGDHIAVIDSYTRRLPNAILNDLDAWYASYDKIKSVNAVKLLPGHDATNFDQEIYGE